MKTFDVSEIFQFAIKIEENGTKFYWHAAQMAKDAKMKEVFNSLAEDEIEHKKIFEDMLSQMHKYDPSEFYPEEYFEYLHSYVDGIIFTGELQERELPVDTLSAIKFAIQRELDSILYYQEIKKFVTKDQHDLIDRIIEEERKHFLKLSKFLKELTPEKL